MNEQQALDRAKETLNAKITEQLIDEFYGLEEFIEGYKFGSLVEALAAITPREFFDKL